MTDRITSASLLELVREIRAIEIPSDWATTADYQLGFECALDFAARKAANAIESLTRTEVQGEVLKEPVAIATLKEDCCVRVFTGDRCDFGGHMCGKSAKINRQGKWYCSIHDPVAVKARWDEQDKQYRARMDAQSAHWRLTSYAADMLDLLVESQTSIGGDWRERRDALILKATTSSDEKRSGSP